MISAIETGDRVKQHQMEIQFSSNIIDSTDFPIRLDVARDFNFRVFDLKFSKTINCDTAEKLKHNSFLKKYVETIYFRIDGESTNAEDGYSSLSTILSNKCEVRTYWIAIISTVIVLTLILVIVAVAFFIRFSTKRQQTSMTIPDGKTYRETQIMIQIEHSGLLKTDL